MLDQRALPQGGLGLVMFLQRFRVVYDGGPNGAWLSINVGRIVVEPDDRFVFKVYRFGPLVQTDRSVTLVRARRLPRLWNSRLMLHLSAEDGTVVDGCVEMTDSERRTVDSVLRAAGFEVTNVVTKWSRRSPDPR